MHIYKFGGHFVIAVYYSTLTPDTFLCSSLPAVETITVNVYREPDKKRKKEKNILIG